MTKKRTTRLASHFPFAQNQKRESLIPASVLFGKDVKVMSLLERQRNLPLRSSLRKQSNEEILCGLTNSARVVWHLPCYTSTRNTRSAVKSLQSQISDIESDCSKGNEGCRLSRSATDVIHWSKCLFCKKRTYLKSKDLINVCTFEPSENIRKAAEAQGDESMLHVLRSIGHDLIGAEAKCHNNCYSLYILKKDPKAEECNSLREVSFQELVAEITRGIREGTAYDMTTLLTMYQTDLESKDVDASSYSKQHLKARLQKRYGGELIFHMPTARFKPELAYGSTIMVQDILNAWAELQSKKEEERIENEIFRVVKHIKQEISEIGEICAAPFNVNDVSLECVWHRIPDSLYLLLCYMITSDITNVSEVFASKAECKNSNKEWLVISIAQDIMYCCSKSKVKLPRHVSLAMCVQHLTDLSYSA
mgnify:CR=1 FL=1